MSAHNICFRGEIRKIFTRYPPLSGPMSPWASCCQWYISTTAQKMLYYTIADDENDEMSSIKF